MLAAQRILQAQDWTLFKTQTRSECVVQWTGKENIWPSKFHVTSAWQQERGRHPTREGSLAPLPAHKISVIKLWNRFGLDDDSVQSATEEGSIISCRAGVRGCVSLHAGAVLCQQTSRLASSVSFPPSPPDRGVRLNGGLVSHFEPLIYRKGCGSTKVSQLYYLKPTSELWHWQFYLFSTSLLSCSIGYSQYVA